MQIYNSLWFVVYSRTIRFPNLNTKTKPNNSHGALQPNTFDTVNNFLLLAK